MISNANSYLYISLFLKGTALGLTTSIQMIGMGIANIIVGKMLDLIK